MCILDRDEAHSLADGNASYTTHALLQPKAVQGSVVDDELGRHADNVVVGRLELGEEVTLLRLVLPIAIEGWSCYV